MRVSYAGRLEMMGIIAKPRPLVPIGKCPV